jgi:hypothetical protein
LQDETIDAIPGSCEEITIMGVMGINNLVFKLDLKVAPNAFLYLINWVI